MVTISPGHIAMMMHHHVPEIKCPGLILLIPCELITAGQANEFGNLCIGMLSGQDILSLGNGIQDCLVMEDSR